MTKNLKEIVLQQIYDILVGKENEIDKLKVLITLLQRIIIKAKCINLKVLLI